MSEEIVPLLDLLEKEKRYADTVNIYSQCLNSPKCDPDLVDGYINRRSVAQEKLNNIYVCIKDWLDKLN